MHKGLKNKGEIMANNKIILDQSWDEIFNKYEENNLTNHAFPLYLFTVRLYDELVKKGCKDILFMSREGQFLKKLFERYCQLRKEAKKMLQILRLTIFMDLATLL